MKISSATSLMTSRLKFLIYGHAGSGKTYLARTIEEPVLVFSAESGLLTLSGCPIDVYDTTTNDDGSMVPAELRYSRIQEGFKYLLTEECRAKYKWIFVDSLTEVSQNLMDVLKKEFPDRKDSLPMYGENATRMRALIKAFRDLPWYNVVFTALAEDEKDENNKRIKSISMIGKMAQQVPAFFDEVFYLFSYENSDGQLERKLVTKATEKAVAKDRSGKLSMYEEPNLQIIADKIKGVLSEQQSISGPNIGEGIVGVPTFN